MLKAVLFDLDQTLIDWDSAESWEVFAGRRMGALRDFVHEHVYPLPEVDGLTLFSTYAQELNRAWESSGQTLRSPNVREILAEVLRFHEVPVEQIDLDAVVRAYDWGPAEGECLYQDVPEVLPQLRAHGVELGVVTNASHPMALRDRELRAMSIIDYFPRCRIAAVDVGVIKPHPAIFEHALGLVGARPEEAVFVGDNLIADIKGAQGAGMIAVWRKGPDAEAELVAHAGEIVPDGVINTLHDLLPLLDGWFPGWRNGVAI